MLDAFTNTLGQLEALAREAMKRGDKFEEQCDLLRCELDVARMTAAQTIAELRAELDLARADAAMLRHQLDQIRYAEPSGLDIASSY